MESQEINASPRRADIGIETVMPADMVSITNEDFPWISAEQQVPLVEVQLENLPFTIRYGSAVKGNNSIRKLADDVPERESIKAEAGMFKGLVPLLTQQTAPSIETVVLPSVKHNVYKTAKIGRGVARLFFTVLDDGKGPLVIKLGIASHKKQEAMYGIMLQNHNHRTKKDG